AARGAVALALAKVAAAVAKVVLAAAAASGWGAAKVEAAAAAGWGVVKAAPATPGQADPAEKSRTLRYTAADPPTSPATRIRGATREVAVCGGAVRSAAVPGRARVFTPRPVIPELAPRTCIDSNFRGVALPDRTDRRPVVVREWLMGGAAGIA